MIVFDLDGTLADCSHRLHLIANRETADWDAFHKLCDKDAPFREAITLCMVLAQFHRVEIWTGRTETYKPQTVKWLNQHGVFGISDLKMRKAGDHRPDIVIKEEWIENSIYTPNLVFEDRSRLVQMYRKNGIRCYQVANGDF